MLDPNSYTTPSVTSWEFVVRLQEKEWTNMRGRIMNQDFTFQMRKLCVFSLLKCSKNSIIYEFIWCRWMSSKLDSGYSFSELTNCNQLYAVFSNHTLNVYRRHIWNVTTIEDTPIFHRIMIYGKGKDSLMNQRVLLLTWCLLGGSSQFVVNQQMVRVFIPSGWACFCLPFHSWPFFWLTNGGDPITTEPWN